jgi:histidinol-phosphate aminotransferase
MRIGFAMADPALIRYLNDVKYSYNSYTMNRTALMAGVSAIEDDKYFRETTVKIIETREWTKEKLSELGFTFGDSKSNFIFASHKKVPARTIFETLRSENIFVRYFDKPRIDNYLRISIGTDDEMKEMVRVLERHLQ